MIGGGHVHLVSMLGYQSGVLVKGRQEDAQAVECRRWGVDMWSVLKSVLAALIGVQNDRQRRQDFSSERPAAFIVTGVVVTLLFVLAIAWLAKWVAG